MGGNSRKLHSIFFTGSAVAEFEAGPAADLCDRSKLIDHVSQTSCRRDRAAFGEELPPPRNRRSFHELRRLLRGAPLRFAL